MTAAKVCMIFYMMLTVEQAHHMHPYVHMTSLPYGSARQFWQGYTLWNNDCLPSSEGCVDKPAANCACLVRVLLNESKQKLTCHLQCFAVPVARMIMFNAQMYSPNSPLHTACRIAV